MSLHVTGSFSTMVNLDALARWTRIGGGVVCQPLQPCAHFDTYAILLGQTATGREMEHAFS